MRKTIQFNDMEIATDMLMPNIPSGQRPFHEGVSFVKIKDNFEKRRHIFRWLTHNCGGPYQFGSFHGEYIFAFDDPSDATLFMLKWAG